MDAQELERNVVAERSFWVACGLAIIGGVGPLVAAAGHTNRLASVVVPFLAAAGANAALALTYRRGRSFTALIYFLGGLAIAYGLLLVLAIPMRLAVEGTCPPAPQVCTNGLELQLSGYENLALSIAVGFGALSLLTGFFGLLTLYRGLRPGTAKGPTVWPSKEPEGWRQKAPEPAAKPEEKPAENPAEEPAEKESPEPPKAEEPS
ncbi:MAG TPA: hypothetical protein VFL29_06350 [Candidatus Dormibacteraeota bacterium]|nr:hypothetical protein [Candidatus Dormibacteraeota bacterium]